MADPFKGWDPTERSTSLNKFGFDEESDYKPKRNYSTMAKYGVFILLFLLSAYLVTDNIFTDKGLTNIITGRAVSGGGDNNQTPDNAGGEGVPGQESAESGSLESAYRNIEVNAAVELEYFSLPIANKDIEVTADSLTIISDDMEIEVKLNGPMKLEGFSGNIVWENSRLALNGDLAKYLADYLTINWKDKKSLVVGINDGSLKMESVEITSFGGVASGDISIGQGEKVRLKLEKESMSMKDYKGSFESHVSNNRNTVIVSGFVGDLLFDATKFNVNVD